MNSFDWQLAAVIPFVALAAWVIVRRVMRLFHESPSPGCGSGGCSSCPSNATQNNSTGSRSSRQGSPTTDGFVSLQTLVQSSQAAHKPHQPEA
ncbi:MAG: hypothetical protein NTZ32_14620 [Planctomycetales bacterium]|nr:hypothetical protein [Planctomycetales bacterium]